MFTSLQLCSFAKRNFRLQCLIEFVNIEITTLPCILSYSYQYCHPNVSIGVRIQLRRLNYPLSKTSLKIHSWRIQILIDWFMLSVDRLLSNDFTISLTRNGALKQWLFVSASAFHAGDPGSKPGAFFEPGVA